MSKIYIAEFFVDQLYLADQIIKDAGDILEFLIRVNVADFPTLEIRRQNLTYAKVDCPENPSHLEFKAGQAVHFTLPPEKFAEKIQKHPLSIKILRQGDSIPICLAELPLSGCLCDKAQLKPFVFGGVIGLVDIGGNPSGEISVTLRITCYGKFVLTSYLLDKGCFLLKNTPEGAEFRVSDLSDDTLRNDQELQVPGRYDPEKDDGNKISPEIEDTLLRLPWEDFMRDIGGISPGAEKLSVGKPPPKQPRAPLTPADTDYAVAPSKTLKKNKTSKTKTKKKKKKK